jgi:deoxycytidine triphosphate deaminase
MSDDVVEGRPLGTGRFAKSNEEAEARFNKYKSLDPHPKISPALLNSADISDYVAKTGMLFPFEENNLKSASYEVNLLGKVIYWDDKGEKRSRFIERDNEFTLVKNSIAYVTPEPTFRLPDYIAIRFNLKITHVHRGILLGTGPLVDPGYEGKLLIPLHNLTANSYKFKGGEGLIWVEFTKLSENKRWTQVDEDPDRLGKYFPFPERKKYLQPENLLEKALENQNFGSIRSSIPDSMQKAEDSAKQSEDSAIEAAGTAKNAADEVEKIRRKFYQISIGGAIALAIALVSLVFSVYSVIENSRSYVIDARVEFNENKKLIDDQIKTIRSSLRKFEELDEEVDFLKRSLKNHETQSENTIRQNPKSKKMTEDVTDK